MRKLLFLLAGVCLLTACGKDPSLADGSDHTYRSKFYTVGEARASYERACGAASRAEAEGVLTPGDYTLDWDQAQISIDSTLYSADVPIELAYDYYRYLEIEDEVYWIPLYPKLVTVTPPDKEHSSVYIRYYVPHEYYEWGHDPEVYDELLNSLPKQDFTGLSLYTTLGGDPVCVASYEEGRLEAYGFLYDKGRSVEENAALMNDILDGLRVGRATKGMSRGVNDINDIEPVVVVGKLPEKEEEEPEKEDDAVNHEEVSPVVHQGGGGPGSTGTTTPSDDNSEGETSSKYNDNIKYTDKDIVEPLLDSIFQDCMGSTLIESLGDVTIVTNSDRNSYNWGTNTINLKYDPDYGYRDYVFLEELIHAYQFQNQDYACDRLLNNEIEAKVGWLLYKERCAEGLSNDLLNRAFGKKQAQYAVFALADSFRYGIPITNNYFIENYYIFAVSLHLLPAYENYSFLVTESSMRFETLVMLMINCPTI